MKNLLFIEELSPITDTPEEQGKAFSSCDRQKAAKKGGKTGGKKHVESVMISWKCVLVYLGLYTKNPLCSKRL